MGGYILILFILMRFWLICFSCLLFVRIGVGGGEDMIEKDLRFIYLFYSFKYSIESFFL